MNKLKQFIGKYDYPITIIGLFGSVYCIGYTLVGGGTVGLVVAAVTIVSYVLLMIKKQ